MKKKEKEHTINILIDNTMPFFQAQKTLSELLSDKKKKLTQKETMSYSLQLAMAELAIGNTAISLQLLADCEKHILSHGLPIEKGTLWLLRSMHLSAQAKYEEALQLAQRALNTAQQLNINAFTFRCLINCGRICLRLLLNTESLAYLNSALELARKLNNKNQIIVCMYQQNEVRKDLVSPEENLRNAEELLAYRTRPKPATEDISDVHIYEAAARAALACGDIEKTKQYNQAATEIKNRIAPNSVMQIDRFLLLANIAVLEKDENEMLYQTTLCIDTTQKGTTPLSSLLAYEVRFEYYLRHNNIKKAKQNLDALNACTVKIGSQMSINKLNKCFVKYYQKTENAAKELEYIKKINEHETQAQQEIMAYRLKHITALHQLEIAEKENKLITQDLHLKSQELSMANHYLQQRNELLSDLKGSINLLKKENAQREQIFQTLFKKIDAAFNKEDAEKEIFKEKFDKTHAHFIQALTRQYSTLSPTESRICALLHSGFNTKEIATLLSTSERNIETHRLHIRKKLGLKQGANLNMTLAAIKV